MGLIEAGKLTLVIDKTYPLAEAADAMRYLEVGQVRGKVVFTVGKLVGRKVGEDSARANGTIKVPKLDPKRGMCPILPCVLEARRTEMSSVSRELLRAP